VALSAALLWSGLVTPLASGTTGGAIQDPRFRDVGEAVGLNFIHDNGSAGGYTLPEITGQGAGLVDFDNDGDLDAYLVQSGALPTGREGPRRAADQLFRNSLSARGELGFDQVTQSAGFLAVGYGMGIASGDYDGDGWADLYVTNLGANQLLRNNGDGTFSDVTVAAGVTAPEWSTSATFVDLDGDHLPDLYVASYVDFDFEANPTCYAPTSARDFCGPQVFPAATDRLFHNVAGVRFEDITRAALVGYEPRPGLGVVATDFDGNGYVDLYVANDGQVNQLWLNRGDGVFVDDALLAGVAVNREGVSEASMGVDAADFDNDGDEDLFMTHLMGETNTLYVNDGAGFFEDRTAELGLAAASLAFTGFGTGWLDYDSDGWLDLVILNGAVGIIDELALAGDTYPLDQPNQLYHNGDGQRFEDVSHSAGPEFRRPEVSRGAAFGDIDNDGDVDLLVANNQGRARLLVNETARQGDWIGLVLQDRRGERHGAGTRLALGGVQRRARADGSYCSTSDRRLLLPSIAGTEGATLQVTWPDGATQTLAAPPSGKYSLLRRAEPTR
jgi:hypothetical protein